MKRGPENGTNPERAKAENYRRRGFARFMQEHKITAVALAVSFFAHVGFLKSDQVEEGAQIGANIVRLAGKGLSRTADNAYRGVIKIGRSKEIANLLKWSQETLIAHKEKKSGYPDFKDFIPAFEYATGAIDKKDESQMLKKIPEERKRLDQLANKERDKLKGLHTLMQEAPDPFVGKALLKNAVLDNQANCDGLVRWELVYLAHAYPDVEWQVQEMIKNDIYHVRLNGKVDGVWYGFDEDTPYELTPDDLEGTKVSDPVVYFIGEYWRENQNQTATGALNSPFEFGVPDGSKPADAAVATKNSGTDAGIARSKKFAEPPLEEEKNSVTTTTTHSVNKPKHELSWAEKIRIAVNSPSSNTNRPLNSDPSVSHKTGEAPLESGGHKRIKRQFAEAQLEHLDRKARLKITDSLVIKKEEKIAQSGAEQSSGAAGKNKGKPIEITIVKNTDLTKAELAERLKDPHEARARRMIQEKLHANFVASFPPDQFYKKDGSTVAELTDQMSIYFINTPSEYTDNDKKDSMKVPKRVLVDRTGKVIFDPSSIPGDVGDYQYVYLNNNTWLVEVKNPSQSFDRVDPSNIDKSFLVSGNGNVYKPKDGLIRYVFGSGNLLITKTNLKTFEHQGEDEEYYLATAQGQKFTPPFSQILQLTQDKIIVRDRSEWG